MRYQIQEMMHIERLAKPREVAHEVETYNELIPKPGELSASLLIEYETPAALEDHVWLVVNGAPASCARFDDRQISTGRIGSDQYIKFQLPPEAIARWCDGARWPLDHPAYPADRSLSAREIEELANNLA